MPTLNWIGKEKVVNHHLDVPYLTLDRRYSYDENGRHENDNGSENMIIHGDNLTALKSLLPRYEGRIKCIYIDPPYNTGNEKWVYNDNVNSPIIKKWIGEVVGAEGEDLSRHDKWLCMMYPRLRLLHKLLADDGVIFISIDDNELCNLKMICDEIFGLRNFLLQMPRITKRSGKSTDIFAKNHDYILIYSKTNNANLNAFEHNDENFKYKDEYFETRGYYKLNQTLDYDSLQYSKSLDYPLEINGITYYAGTSYDEYLKRQSGNYKRADWAWRWSLKKFQFGYDNGFIVVKKSKNGTRIYTKTYQKATIAEKNGSYIIEYMNRTAPTSSLILSENEFSNDNATKLMTQIFSNKVFDYSKPTSLLKFILKLSTNTDDIILDSFAGSGTTAHAVLDMNKADGGNRKFILIEMEDYADSITAERVKRVIHGYGDGKKAVDGTGGNFSFYELGQPILKDDLLNEDVDIQKIREYIFYTETKQIPTSKDDEPFFLGEYESTAYYFIYEKNAVTSLDRDFLHTIKTKSERYVIYADKCPLSDETLKKWHITFRKIPRDITRI